VTQVGERIWLVTFMQYDLGYFDDETCRLEPIENPFGPKVLLSQLTTSEQARLLEELNYMKPRGDSRLLFGARDSLTGSWPSRRTGR